GVSPAADITTLGRGGSDTTASALGAALQAERVEIYTHVDGVMTADPDVVAEARTLPVVTYEEVCNMAHHGAKVLHPRAAEIARRYHIPLWVKSVFSDSPGTRVAPLTEIQPPTLRGVTGIAHLANLAHVTLEAPYDAAHPHLQLRLFETLGDADIPLSLLSLGERSFSFLVDRRHAETVERITATLNVPRRVVPDCDMVSVVALNMWEVPGFLCQIANALCSQGIPMLQMADSEGSVACLVRKGDAPRAARALHARFELGQ
ncbi:MAG: ACT domain-containing protein, partial [Armatimonadetes bacterium]|nr:ACT domain-containing protein [Armatimonadota bacterium]